jgi:hypothetical protein
MNKSLRFYLFCSILLIAVLNLSAKGVDGYIIAKGGEKIYGSIRVSSVHYPTGAISINNINYTPLYVSVFFKETGKKRFKEYFADEIDGFSFYYQDQQIFFFSIGLPVREWDQVKMHKKFLRLIVNGYFILFDSKSLVRFGDNYTEVTDYYVSDAQNKVFNIADYDFAHFKEFLLKQLKMEPEFIKNQPYKINAKNIKTIIINYNQWVKHVIRQ